IRGDRVCFGQVADTVAIGADAVRLRSAVDLHAVLTVGASISILVDADEVAADGVRIRSRTRDMHAVPGVSRDDVRLARCAVNPNTIRLHATTQEHAVLLVRQRSDAVLFGADLVA